MSLPDTSHGRRPIEPLRTGGVPLAPVRGGATPAGAAVRARGRSVARWKRCGACANLLLRPTVGGGAGPRTGRSRCEGGRDRFARASTTMCR
ncbi:hypothetical protein DFP74_3448 [Nocardiopsis sp. Huas11]|nr:hypothetical protein DFP74_3448 [Nocardiopsis sp. Huas11]